MAGSTLVEAGKIITLHCVLRVDGEESVVDTRQDDEPMSYLHGAGNVVPGLESALTGRSVGETVQAVVPPDTGFGERDPDALQAIPRETFPGDLQLEIGMQLTAEDEEGNLMPMFVHEISEDDIIVDLNHPLAGHTLHYEVTIVEVRDATDEEREHGHSHAPGGHEH